MDKPPEPLPVSFPLDAQHARFSDRLLTEGLSKEFVGLPRVGLQAWTMLDLSSMARAAMCRIMRDAAAAEDYEAFLARTTFTERTQAAAFRHDRYTKAEDTYLQMFHVDPVCGFLLECFGIEHGEPNLHRVIVHPTRCNCSGW